MEAAAPVQVCRCGVGLPERPKEATGSALRNTAGLCRAIAYSPAAALIIIVLVKLPLHVIL